MSKLKLTRRISVAILLIWVTLLTGCGGGLSGTYSDRRGMMSIKFDSSKAYMKFADGTAVEAPYKLDGDKVILKNPRGPGNLMLTRNEDGSLEGPLGTLTKGGDVRPIH